jgi:hypothetical protein
MALYGAYGIVVGRVYAKHGISSRCIDRNDEPISFWATCICYIFVGSLIYFTILHKYS